MFISIKRGEFMYSISKLCNEFNLSRSTLLYYDKIGLLTPSGRSSANYRQYSEEDKMHLSKICAFREAGVSLDQIKDILDNDGMNESNILESRLKVLNKEIRFLRFQQKIIIEMLKEKNLSNKNMLIDKETFKLILKSAGLEDELLNELHIQFEKNSPEAHQSFLEFLGVSAEEIELIRDSSKNLKK